MDNYNIEDTSKLITAGRTGANRKRLILAVAAVALIAAIGVAGVFLVKDRKYNEQIAIAEKCLQEGDYAGAEAGYASAVSMNRRREKGHKGLAYTYVLEEKYADASNTYTQLYEMTNEEVYRTAAEETSSGMPPTDPELFPSDDLWIKVSEGQVPDAGGMTHFMETYLEWSDFFPMGDQNADVAEKLSFDNSNPGQSNAFPVTFVYFANNSEYTIYPEYSAAGKDPQGKFVETDPRGWNKSSCIKIGQEALDRVYSDLFNVESEKIPEVLAEAERRGIMYLDGGYYYECLGAHGTVGVNCSVNRWYVSKGKCFIEYDMLSLAPGAYEGTYVDTFYAMMELKEINGNRQWTMLYNGKEIPEEMKEILSRDDSEDTKNDEDPGDMEILQEIADENFVFSGGGAAWVTEMKISQDGIFSGDYKHLNFGNPDEPQEFCSFEGQIGRVEKISDYEYDLIVKGDLKLDEQHGRTEMRNGTLTSYTDPHGLENIKDGSRLKLLMPGYQTSGLSNEARNWFMGRGQEAPEILDRPAIYNKGPEYLFL